MDIVASGSEEHEGASDSGYGRETTVSETILAVQLDDGDFHVVRRTNTKPSLR